MGGERTIPHIRPAKIWIGGQVELTNGWHTAILVDLGEVRALDTVRGIAEIPDLDVVGNVKTL